MVSIPFRYEETTCDLLSVESKYVYTDVYPGYNFCQAHFPKTSSHAYPVHFEPFSDNIYSNWTGATPNEYYLADHQITQEQYANEYTYDMIATTYMPKCHDMEYELSTRIPNNSGFFLNFTSEYLSPNCDSTAAPSYPQTAWSPSEPSVASLSPPYDIQWEGKDPVAYVEHPGAEEADEVLQGLGLYDCPELASDHGPFEQPCASYRNSGRGLKLEESFEFKEEYSDDEDEEDEGDEEQYDED
ncbi:hypothetical protein TWF718_008898 [Orbilia javanica]|uniref:Uncharacterized protein n=1 Tax=Orbilia javanica TaxID=47235 RepID=A0AAN8MKP9_9PEZI